MVGEAGYSFVPLELTSTVGGSMATTVGTVHGISDAPKQGKRLESWKDIANYLGRGLRTVRRWEQEEGLPIHRHVHRKQGTIWALAGEIDAWLRDRSGLGDLGTRHGNAHPSPGNGQGAISNGRGSRFRPVVIAVLPHRSLGDSSFDRHLAEGLAEALLSKISRLNQDRVRIVAYSTVMQYLQTGRSVTQLSRDFGVNYILETGGRVQDFHVRFIACLVNACDQIQLWTDSFELEIPSPLSMQQEVADKLINGLASRLGLPTARNGKPPH
jgi:TolB-like protein